MNAPIRKPYRHLAVAVALALLAPAAQAASGSFAFVTGEVALTKGNGQRVVPVRGTEVDAGDSIATGPGGMAQLTMIDQARLSLRPNTQFKIESYGQSADSQQGVVLSLLKGTLRTFTGLIAAQNRDKFQMRTRVATVGIRGSGNILYACSDKECDPGIAGAGTATGDITVNHTIEGSHAVTNLPEVRSGVPAQQGGPQTLITGPGQTVLIQGTQPPRYIPTPQFIADTATNPTGAAKSAAAATTAASGDAQARNFAPGEGRSGATGAAGSAIGAAATTAPTFVTVDATGNLAADPLEIRDVIISAGGPFLGQSTRAQLATDGATALRGYTSYAGTQSNFAPAMVGGELREAISTGIGGTLIQMGRYQNASLGFEGTSSALPFAGNIHWIYGPAGFPSYLSEVLTGSATYTLVSATAPTNQANTAGVLGSATLNVNFTNRTLGLQLALSIPAGSGNGGGSWGLTAINVPLTLNSFFATTGDLLVITNGAGQSSATNPAIFGSVEGSLVGANLQAAILGYGFSDQSSPIGTNHNTVTGVAALSGPAQAGSAPHREGRVSDPLNTLAGSAFSRAYATTNRPDEVTSDAQGRVTAFTAPFTTASRVPYALGSAQVVQSGIDSETGLVWGRWGGGTATAGSTPLALNDRSLHYIFAGPQNGPVALPLTGTATYDVLGSTSPTDRSGHVGTLGTATLTANFTNRTAAATVNVTVNGTNWIGTAPSMPIYRDQFFSASTGSLPGLPNPSPFGITCNPACGNPTGSLDGFFAGRTGQRAGVLYNMGPVSGVVAFTRRGG